ncbi:MAG: MipA/OmpV family protein [Ghiorsea sp.]
MNTLRFLFLAKKTFFMLLLWLGGAQTAYAGEEKLPLWELGIGAGGISLPQYMGSDERYNLPFVFPYVVYRGKHWKVDRGGVRNRLFDSDQLSLDISLSGGLPVRNDNQARSGMPELFLTGEVGPKVNWFFTESEHDSWSAHFPLRAAINSQAKYVGWVSDPHVNYTYHHDLNEGILRLGFDVGMQFNDQLYHETYYAVEPAYANPQRPAYQPSSGLHSIFFKARLRYPIEKGTDVIASIQARSLAGGVVQDSPLVKSNFYGTVGLGMIWTFSTSDEMVVRED